MKNKQKEWHPATKPLNNFLMSKGKEFLRRLSYRTVSKAAVSPIRYRAAYRALVLEAIAAFVKEEAATEQLKEQQLREQQRHEHSHRSSSYRSSIQKSSNQESNLKAAVGGVKSSVRGACNQQKMSRKGIV